MSSRVIKSNRLIFAAFELIPAVSWQPVFAQTMVPGGETGTEVIRDGNNWVHRIFVETRYIASLHWARI